MSILFCGGEINDFEHNNSLRIEWGENTNYFRSEFARGYIKPGSDRMYTPVFSQIVTRLWSTQRFKYESDSSTYNTAQIGFCLGQDDNNCFYIYRDAGKYVIKKKEEGVITDLATSVLTTIAGGWINYKLDVFINYGVSGIIIVYIDGVEFVRYEGDNTISGVAGFDRSFLIGNAYNSIYISEIIVADEDTRSMSLKTLAPVANGDVNQWNGDYTKIDDFGASEETLGGDFSHDLNVLNTDVSEQDAQFDVSDIPIGDYVCKAVKMIYRAADGGLGNAGLQAGIKTNGDIYLDNIVSLDSYFKNFAVMYQSNPNTLNAFTIEELNSLQLAVRSKSV